MNKLIPTEIRNGMNNEEIVLTSIDVVNKINEFRMEEGKNTLKRHSDFLTSIEKEIETLEKAGIGAERNFSLGKYVDKNNQERPCYKMNKAGIMQMLNKESALVRYKTQQYIEALENKIQDNKPQVYNNNINEMINTMMPTLIQNTIQSTMMAMGTILENNNKVIMGEIERVKELHMESKNIINENEIRHKKELDETKELIGLRAKNTMSLTKLLKSRISCIKGEDINAKDYHYILAKEKVFRAMQVWTWEEISINKFNDVHALIDSIETLEDIFDI